MKIGFISTALPRECGIATFSASMQQALLENSSIKNPIEIELIAISDVKNTYKYPDELLFEVKQNRLKDYLEAAKVINYSSVDIFCLQHEFGIYGGSDGIFVLPMIDNIEKPLISVLHTIPKSPSFIQRNILQKLAKKSQKIVVMCQLGVDFLKENYQIPKDKIKTIPHGFPSIKTLERKRMKKLFGVENKKVLCTFGLLSRNKGIETVIYAMEKIVKKFPEALYIIAGKTHPGVLAEHGEEYRFYLKQLVKDLGLENNIVFKNKFLSEKDIFHYLNVCDLYVIPYLNEAQITSGTLSFAIGAGSAVVSTPFWHAKEILQNGAGRLFEFNNSEHLAKVVVDLLGNEDSINQMRKEAAEIGKSISWKLVGQQYQEVFSKTIKNKARQTKNISLQIKEDNVKLIDLPEYNLKYIDHLTDDTGIIQHAKYIIPNWKEGYCIDDNARALLLTLKVYNLVKSRETLAMITKYLSYIHYMQRDDGQFRNFLSFDRRYLDEVGSEDSFGRTIWSLGYLYYGISSNQYISFVGEILEKARPHLNNLRFIRSIANSIIGLNFYIKSTGFQEKDMEIMKNLSQKVYQEYKKNSSTDWQWFENTLTYDNALLPLSMLLAYEILGEKKLFVAASKTLKFLEETCFQNDIFVPIGNDGWYTKGKKRAEFDQQPLDLMAMVLLYFHTYRLTKKSIYLKNLQQCHSWFLGHNLLRSPLFDYETCGCCDGLNANGTNHNQGAESSLAYWISHFTVLEAYSLSYEISK